MWSWATTFARFEPGDIPLIGPIVVRVVDWSKPRPGRGSLFEYKLLDEFSVAHPIFPFAVYAPTGVWLAWHAWKTGLSAATVVAAYLAGLFVWSLLEYIAHRKSFHRVPTTEGQVAYGYLVHGVHHAYPDDSRRWVMPVLVTLPILLALFWLFKFVLGHAGEPTFAGFLHGYLTYDLLHYFIHRGRMPTRFGRFLRQYHLAHHYALPDRHFGVSSPLWDLVFRTR